MIIGLPAAHGGLRMAIKLAGDEQDASLWRIAQGDVVHEGELAAREERWVTIDIPASRTGHELTLRFDTRAMDDGLATYFVQGFFVPNAADERARLDFIEAVALGNLDTLSAFGNADHSRR